MENHDEELAAVFQKYEIADLSRMSEEEKDEVIHRVSENIRQKIGELDDFQNTLTREIEDTEKAIESIKIQIEDHEGAAPDELQEKLQALTDKKEFLKQRSQEIQGKISVLYEDQRTLDRRQITFSYKEKNSSDLRAAWKAPSAAVRSAVKNGAKGVMQKINPLDQKIDQNDTSETGVESLRLGYTTIKSAKNTVKSAKSGIKTAKTGVKTTAEAAKYAVKTVYRTSVRAVKAAAFAVRTTVTVMVHIAAALTNPVVWIIIAAAFIFLILVNGITILLFGGDTSTRDAYMNAAGLSDTSNEYSNGLAYFQKATEDRKAEYDALIDALSYNSADLPNSDLVYMGRVIYGDPDVQTTYTNDFATDAYKTTLHNAWGFQLDSLDALAIAYVYLEKKQNTDHGTEANIYNVTYTQDVFDEILGICVQFAEQVHENKTCPNANCTTVQVENPEWRSASDEAEEAEQKYNEAVAAKDEEQMEYWKEIYDNAVETRDSLPEQIDQPSCDHLHDLHSIGVIFLTADDVMNALQFTTKDKEWVKYTKAGLQSQTTS